MIDTMYYLKDTLKEINLLEINRKDVVGGSEAFQSILKVALKLTRIEVSNILLLGESGTGKGLLAKFIHKCSQLKTYNAADRTFYDAIKLYS